MGVDAIIRTVDGEFISYDLPSCRSGGWAFWENMFPKRHINQSTKIPLQEYITMLESEIAKLSREEIIDAYMMANEWGILTLYKKVYEYKDNAEQYVIHFE